MKRENKICGTVCVVTVLLTLAGILFLPDTVIVQRTAVTGATTYLPKAWGILLAASFSVAGPIGVRITKKPESKKYGILVLTALGYLMFLYMFLVN